MIRLGPIILGIGAIIFFAGCFWIKGPAIMPVDYFYGFICVGLGAAITTFGVRVVRRPPKVAGRTKIEQ